MMFISLITHQTLQSNSTSLLGALELDIHVDMELFSLPAVPSVLFLCFLL
jgi:hypothetical protein